jgi:outer membrane protein TolC
MGNMKGRAVERLRYDELPGPSQQIARGENTGGPGGVGGAKNVGTSPPVSATNTLDLGTALRLAGVDNPTINLARETIREALAQQFRARVMLVPDVNIGGNYHYHTGTVQSSSGLITSVNDQSLYMGAGALAVASGTTAIPGLWLAAHLGDAIYEPLAARENVSDRQATSIAVQNAVMGDVVTAYLRLVGSEARLEVIRRAHVEGDEVVRLSAEFAKVGLGRPSDANRARSFNDLVERERYAAEEEVEVASAQLCRLLNLDPSNHLRTPGASLEPFRVFYEDTDAEALIARALKARPELAARYANLREAEVRVRQEKIRPYLPSVFIGVSTGAFGGESSVVNQGFTQLAGRTDIDAVAVWKVQNLGFGNRARVREMKATVVEAVAEYESTRNRIRSEVIEALADARSAAQKVEIARRAVRNSSEGFRLDLDRIKGGAGVDLKFVARPIELLDSFDQILESRQALVAAVAAFDIAQFRLFVAVGSNPLDEPNISRLAPPVIPDISTKMVPVSPEPMPIQLPSVVPAKP